WFHCTPVSMLATVMPSPRSLYVDHTWGALTRWMFHSIACVPGVGAPAAAVPSMMCAVQFGTILDTSGRAATAANVAAPEVIWMALMIQNAWKDAPLLRRRLTRPRWLDRATEVSLL